MNEHCKDCLIYNSQDKDRKYPECMNPSCPCHKEKSLLLQELQNLKEEMMMKEAIASAELARANEKLSTEG